MDNGIAISDIKTRNVIFNPKELITIIVDLSGAKRELTEDQFKSFRPLNFDFLTESFSGLIKEKEFINY